MASLTDFKHELSEYQHARAVAVPPFRDLASFLKTAKRLTKSSGWFFFGRTSWDSDEHPWEFYAHVMRMVQSATQSTPRRGPVSHIFVFNNKEKTNSEWDIAREFVMTSLGSPQAGTALVARDFVKRDMILQRSNFGHTLDDPLFLVFGDADAQLPIFN